MFRVKFACEGGGGVESRIEYGAGGAGGGGECIGRVAGAFGRGGGSG